MKIVIDDKVCKKHKLSLEEVLLALAIRELRANDLKPLGTILNLEKKGILNKDSNGYVVALAWSETLDKILAESPKDCGKTDEELTILAGKIQECFPIEKLKDRSGRETPYYYRCNKTEIKSALRRFFSNYGSVPSDEEIIDATRRYVESFHGVYIGMRLAKYFIFKNDVKPNENGTGNVVLVSDLQTFLENKDTGSQEISSNDWMMQSRN